MKRRAARRTDRFAQLATAAASQALTDSKLDVAKEPERVGVSIATGVGGLGTLVEQVLVMEKRGPSRLSPFMVPMLMSNAGPAQASMQFGLKGPNPAHLPPCSPPAHPTHRSPPTL